MSYTPGQWIADSTTYPLEYWFETQVLHIGSVVAVVRAMSAEQSADHARLIAASPDLLEALKALRVPLQIQFDLHQRMCEREGVDITTSEAYQRAKSRLDMADAAISKAEGAQ